MNYSKTFKTAIEMAIWINENISDPLEQENVMLEGVNNRMKEGKYRIFRKCLHCPTPKVCKEHNICDIAMLACT